MKLFFAYSPGLLILTAFALALAGMPDAAVGSLALAVTIYIKHTSADVFASQIVLDDCLRRIIALEASAGIGADEPLPR
jgi:hypothetical protein